MKADEIDILAAEYVLGSMDSDARALMRDRLATDGALQAAVQAWERRLSILSAEEVPIAPPSGLWEKLSDALDAVEAEAATDRFSVTVHRNEGQWQEIVEGVHKKQLFADADEGYQAFLLRLDPGAVVPAHSHSKTEECLMLEGEISIGDLKLSAGDYHIVSAGLDHPDIRSASGGLVYVRAALPAAA